jgi:hypothetical protein
MMQAGCSICETLRKNVVAAITQHYQLLSKLEIARISYDNRVIEKLEPRVRAAWTERLEANEAYQAHMRSHSNNSAQA